MAQIDESILADKLETTTGAAVHVDKLYLIPQVLCVYANAESTIERVQEVLRADYPNSEMLRFYSTHRNGSKPFGLRVSLDGATA